MKDQYLPGTVIVTDTGNHPVANLLQGSFMGKIIKKGSYLQRWSLS